MYVNVFKCEYYYYMYIDGVTQNPSKSNGTGCRPGQQDTGECRGSRPVPGVPMVPNVLTDTHYLYLAIICYVTGAWQRLSQPLDITEKHEYEYTDSQMNDYCDDVESDEERLYLNNWSVVMFIIPRCDQFSASYNIQVFLFPPLAL